MRNVVVEGHGRLSVRTESGYSGGKKTITMQKQDLEFKHAVSARRQSVKELGDVVGSPALKLKSVKASDRSAPILESSATVHTSNRPEILGEIRRRASSTDALKHVEAIRDRSAPRIESNVKVKSTMSYKNVLMSAAAVGARRLSNAQLKGYPSDVVLRATPVKSDRSAPMIPDAEEMKKTPLKVNNRHEMLEEVRRRSMSTDKELRPVDKAKIRDRSKPVVSTNVSGTAAKNKSKKKKDLLSEVKAKGARRLSNSQIKGFVNTGVVLRDAKTNDRSSPMLPKAEEMAVTKKETRKNLVKEIRRRSVISDATDSPPPPADTETTTEVHQDAAQTTTTRKDGSKTGKAKSKGKKKKDEKRKGESDEVDTHVNLRQVETSDKSAPVVLEIMPLHSNSTKRPAVMNEIRTRSDSESRMGLKPTPEKSIKDRSAPKVDGISDVLSGTSKRKEMLTDVRAVGAHNLAVKEIKGFEHTNVVLAEVDTDDRSKPVVKAEDVGTLKKNPQPAVMDELRVRSASVDGGDLTKTLSPPPERRDRSEPNKEIMAEATSSSQKNHGARKELLMDVTVRANRKLSNAAIKGFEGTPMLREVAEKDVADSSAPVVASSGDQETTQEKTKETSSKADGNGSSIKNTSTSSNNGSGKVESEETSTTTEPTAAARADDEDDDDDDGKTTKKKAGILATIVLILTCAICFSKKKKSGNTTVSEEKKADSL